MVSVDRADPPGVHALVVVAEPAPVQEGAALLQRGLEGIGPPPRLPQQWSAQLRGPSTKVGPAIVTPSEYLRDLESRMPSGLEPMHVVFVQAVK